MVKIHDFYETLLYNVQSLETLRKTSECVALVRRILNKLPGIKAELVQGHPEWQSWNFTQLLNVLREWKEIHPQENVKSRDTLRSFRVEERNGNATRGCVYCREVSHKAKDCTAITSVEDLCFNRPFYRYGGHIELIRFKEYYRMPRGHDHISFVFLSAFRDILKVFLE